MFTRSPLSQFAGIVVAIGLVLLPNSAFGQDRPHRQSFTVLNYESGWTHDGAGYHPAIFMALENNSGRDLTNSTVKFQARFTDVETTEVTIGRKNMRQSLEPHQKFTIAIIGRESSNGMEGFELPFEVSYWPKLETKVMCRVGENEETETLVITKLEPETRSEEEAFDHLNQTTTYRKARGTSAAPSATASRQIGRSYSSSSRSPVEASERPLIASADRYGGSESRRNPRSSERTGKTQQERSPSSSRTAGEPNSTLALLNSKTLPGLGDDFFSFEQRYGLPSVIDAKHPDWTWARYRHAGSGTDILAGSRERTAKVDIIIIRIPRSAGVDQASLIAAAKQMAGKYRSQSLPTPSRSVRYLPTGRLELASSTGSSYRVVCMTPPAGNDSDNSFILVVSRVPQDPEALLAGLYHKTSLLKDFRFLDSKASD